MVFPKYCAGIWYLLWYQERWYFLFPKIWSYHLDGKWKMIFLKKAHGNMIFSSGVLKRRSFQKDCTGTCPFFYYLERWYLFSREHDIFSLNGKRKMIFLNKYTEAWHFLCIRASVINVVLVPSTKKKSKKTLTRKNAPKDDWHLRLTF